MEYVIQTESKLQPIRQCNVTCVIQVTYITLHALVAGVSKLSTMEWEIGELMFYLQDVFGIKLSLSSSRSVYIERHEQDEHLQYMKSIGWIERLPTNLVIDKKTILDRCVIVRQRWETFFYRTRILSSLQVYTFNLYLVLLRSSFRS